MLPYSGHIHASECAQPANDSTRIIKLTHIRLGHRAYFKTGNLITFRYNKKSHTGRLDSISTHSFFVKGKEYEFNQIQYMNTWFKLKFFNKISPLFFTVGMVLTVVDIALLRYSKNTGEWYSDEMYSSTFNFYLVLFFCIGFLAAGLVSYLFGLFHVYHIHKQWEIESIVNLRLSNKTT
jgi:hypothetical protein